VTKARACKGASQKGSMRVTFHVLKSVGKCEEMNPHIPSELSLWELEFGWTPEFLDGDYMDQNLLH